MYNHVDNLFYAGGGKQFFLIAGPCVLEDKALHEEIALTLLMVKQALNIPVIFKGSFDKANRSSHKGARGPGLVHGLDMLEEVRESHGLPVLTDIHELRQAHPVGKIVDVIQIPAALCRQTDMLRAAAATGRPINIKKGQWTSADDMARAVQKITEYQKGYPIAVTERGTFFGYGDVVVDMRNILRMQRMTQGCPIIFDASHTVQRPGQGLGGASAGTPAYIAPLARAAVAAGADALFIEVHPRPLQAPSDGASMLSLEKLLPLVQEIVSIREVLGHSDKRIADGALNSDETG
jgi:2-dehydro-3-deoxyphosphooctonate aldolase (KDO 8-P synthase)